jgi:hypothetical protein
MILQFKQHWQEVSSINESKPFLFLIGITLLIFLFLKLNKHYKNEKFDE